MRLERGRDAEWRGVLEMEIVGQGCYVNLTDDFGDLPGRGEPTQGGKGRMKDQ